MMRLSRLFILLALLVSAPLVSRAEDDADYQDFLSYISEPVVPPKALEPIRVHLGDIGNALSRHFPSVRAARDGVDLVLTVPVADFFRANSTELVDEGATRLGTLRDLMKYPTMYRIVVAVYTDDTGDSLYRNNLTETRAEALSDYLYGISPVDNPDITVFAIPYGGYAAPNNSIEGRAANRRVEVHILPGSDMVDMARSGRLKK